ncbi:MAG TPA: NAD-dependent epimerase/dehydratase family protein [Isosphaeraceae bacterium]|nr:NAD-dependent epimerase/dehydratase family protein [Isosphaeraceae bacterium]
MNGLVVVTGGAGFIGSHLVKQLVELGQEVRVVERPGAEVGHLPRQVDVAWADIRDRKTVAKALHKAELVYHLAANPNLWARDRRDFEAVNHQGTVNVLESALEAGARRVLHTSTESILTRKAARGPIDENVEISESDAVGPYCLSKLRAENAAMALARGGRPVVVANPTMPVGPGDRGLSPPTRLIRDFCRGHLPAIMDCTLNLIDVRDVATGLLRAMERGQAGRRYLLGGENLTLASFLSVLSRLSGVSVPRWRVPYSAGLAVAYVSEFWSDYISGSPPKATVTGVRLARRIMHFDPSRSLGELDLAPRPIREAIRDALDWLSRTGQIPEIVPGSRVSN